MGITYDLTKYVHSKNYYQKSKRLPQDDQVSFKDRLEVVIHSYAMLDSFSNL